MLNIDRQLLKYVGSLNVHHVTLNNRQLPHSGSHY